MLMVKNDGISLPCFWKVDARLLLFGAANYAGLTKGRHVFVFTLIMYFNYSNINILIVEF